MLYAMPRRTEEENSSTDWLSRHFAPRIDCGFVFGSSVFCFANAGDVDVAILLCQYETECLSISRSSFAVLKQRFLTRFNKPLHCTVFLPRESASFWEFSLSVGPNVCWLESLMGKNLRSEIITFFLQKMERHDRVTTVSLLVDDENYVYEIGRSCGYSDVRVWLTDDYCFTLDSYYSKPTIIRAGDFILMARPEGSATPEAIEHARLQRITVGKIGHLMGAMNYPDLDQYIPPEQRELSNSAPPRPWWV
jgi:hypothetical protein